MIQRTKKLNVPHPKEVVPVKVMLIGDCQSGKTSLANRYVNSKAPSAYVTTLAVETYDKYLDVKDLYVHITIWDFSGKPEFLDVRNDLYKQSSGVIIAFDLSNKKSLDTLDGWLKQFRDNGGSCPILIAGTKSDAKKVETNMGTLAKEKGSTYFQTSAKENPGSVDQLFMELLNIVL